MSLDQARAFIEKMKSDVAFSERVLAIEDVAERLNLIKSEGFDCNEEEIKEVSNELSDNELNFSAGASACFTVYKEVGCTFFPGSPSSNGWQC